MVARLKNLDPNCRSTGGIHGIRQQASLMSVHVQPVSLAAVPASQLHHAVHIG